MNKNQENNEEKEVKFWLEKIDSAEKHYENYHRLVKETREYYKDAKQAFGSGKYNIFWSSVETLKPFLYFKQPHPYVERSNKTSDPVESYACKILEKALEWDLSQFDFDSVIKYARNDFLISGMGIIWEQYKPEFSLVTDAKNPQNVIEIKTSEVVESTYVNPEYFIADCDNVGIWEDVSWVGKKIFMTKQELLETFGEKYADIIVRPGEDDYRKKEICVYEVWDKNTQKVYWLSKQNPYAFLKVVENPLGLKGFFPCPKPIFATLTNDSIIPVPDYSMIKEMLSELDGINNRMRLTMKALKVSGCYDNSFPELKNILNKDVTLVSLNDFQKLKDNGGIRGIIDFVPVEQYVLTLEQLAARRQDIIGKIFDVTGVSDIMRGSSDPKDTATAVTQKTNFGTLRNQDRQNDMQRFIGDLFRIKAEIICEMFSQETLLSFLSEEEQKNRAVALQAVSLLKTEKLRGMTFGVETDIVFKQEEESAKTLEGVTTINEMISTAFQTVSAQPLLLPLYRQMINAVVSTMPKARAFGGIIENVFSAVEKELMSPQPQKTPEPNIALQLEQQKLLQERELEKEKNALKARELDLKEKIEQNKLYLSNKEMELQAQLKASQLEQNQDSKEEAGDIPSGYVKAFK